MSHSRFHSQYKLAHLFKVCGGWSKIHEIIERGKQANMSHEEAVDAYLKHHNLTQQIEALHKTQT